MTYKILTLKDSEEWKRYITLLPIDQQDIYYTPEYYSLYENYGDGKAMCFIFEKDDNIAIYPFLMNSINELGYNLDDKYFDIQGAYGYNGVISSNYSTEFKKSFYSVFSGYCFENNIVAEFTRFHPIIKNYTFSLNCMEVYYDRETVFLDINESEEAIYKNSYSSNNRNMIRKALRNNIEIIKSVDKKDYKEFYSIYVETMMNVKSSSYLYFNELYFLNFIKYLPNNHRLILAKYNNKLIGGMILMMYKNYAHYHLSCRKKDYGKFALNNLFLDYAIKYAKSKGHQYFHFGGGNSSNKHDSLLKFKSNFSKERCDFYIGKKIHNTDIYDKIVNKWITKFPESYKNHKNKLLGYREIKNG